jgi:hypothetical protein
MKTYKNVELRISQEAAQFLIVAAKLERDRLKKTDKGKVLASKAGNLILYLYQQLHEAQKVTEVDLLIDKIAKWD